MRRLTPIALTLTLLLTAHPADAKRHRAKPSCSPKGSTTVEANAQIRVFRIRASDATKLYACRLGTRKRFLMGSAQDPGGTGVSVNFVRVAGPFVAWDTKPFDDSQRYNPTPQTFPSAVNALDTRSGTTRKADAATGTPAESDVTALVLQRSGSFAWIGSAPAGLEVHRYDSSGDAVLASGSDIDPKALAASDSVLFWLKGGAAASAPFS